MTVFLSYFFFFLIILIILLLMMYPTRFLCFFVSVGSTAQLLMIFKLCTNYKPLSSGVQFLVTLYAFTSVAAAGH